MTYKYMIGLLLVAEVFTTLQVYSPACAASRFNGPIEYTLSNFGELPYGQTIVGQIRRPKNDLLCSSLGQTYFTNVDPLIKNIMIVQRGECKFTQKVINAQNLGADVIIIFDNNAGDDPKVVMKNDGHGHLAKIPSLFISNTAGLNLITTDAKCQGLPVIKIEFDIEQSEISHVTLWLDANNRESFILARDFHKNKYYQALENKINLDIRFRVQASCQGWSCPEEDCIGTSTEKYCRNVQKSDNIENIPTGSEILEEQLREYFLWEQLKEGGDKSKWWKYMIQFDKDICIGHADKKDCSFTAMNEVGIDKSVIQKINILINQTLTNITESKPNILKEVIYEAGEMGIYFYPQATINNRNFYGLFKAPEVFDAICESLITAPTECYAMAKINQVQQGSSIFWTIFIILLCMTIGFFIALFIYTRIIRREVNQQLSLEVNKMVENYVNLAEKKSTSDSYVKM